jgi:hypothetical protein
VTEAGPEGGGPGRGRRAREREAGQGEQGAPGRGGGPGRGRRASEREAGRGERGGPGGGGGQGRARPPKYAYLTVSCKLLYIKVMYDYFLRHEWDVIFASISFVQVLLLRMVTLRRKQQDRSAATAPGSVVAKSTTST